MNATAAKTIVEKRTLIEEAFTLYDFLQDVSLADEVDLTTVYVEDEHGNQFGSVKLVEETLTDGSKVFNLVLSQAA